MSRERKKFCLRSAARPAKDPRICSTVIVDDVGVTVCYIQFDECFVDAIGGVMSRGVSVEDPVYLMVDHAEDDTWAVYVAYIGRVHGRELLWVDPNKPRWVRAGRPPRPR